jgi:DNA invertase Pin-like site-specific DNA recombinase
MTMKKAIGYIRVSSEEQADSGLGLEAQRQRITTFCAMKGLDLVEVFEDAAVSGGKPLASRPAGSRMLADARKSKAVVIVAKFDRLFRSVADAAVTIADFDRKGLELVAIAEGFDMTNPYGRAMAQMASVFAELERAMIRERTRAALKVKMERGERVSRHAPFGWDFGSAGNLVANVQEQDIIRLIRGLRADGKSFRDIAAHLNGQGILAKHGGQWGHTSVKAVLTRNAA